MKLLVCGFIILFFYACSLSSEERVERLPFHSDLSSNAKEWSLGYQATYDTQEKAIKFSKSGAATLTSDHAVSAIQFPVEPQTRYTISFQSKTSVWPPPILEVFGGYYGENGFIANSLGSLTSNSKPGIWEENNVYIHIPNNQAIKTFQIKILDAPKKSKNGDIWVKNITLAKGIKTSSITPEKKSFDGTITKVDELGNIFIKRHGKFEPFFPIGIYTDHKRDNWSIYKRQGFNTAMWCVDASSIQKAKDAGLYAGMQLTQYIIDVSWMPKDQASKQRHLREKLREINNRGLSSNLLFYYIDNEFYDITEPYLSTVEAVKTLDIDSSGKRMHPIYMLNGAYGLARKYSDNIDFTGTYVAEDRYETDRTPAFELLNQAENQTQPAVIAQINRGIGNNFRPILFGAIAKGAKGVAFWKDGAEAGDIQSQPWWRELPKIADEITSMMPLIQTSTDTSWSATADQQQLIVGTRTLDGKAYMIITNPNRKRIDTTCTLQGLSYQPTQAVDYFSHNAIANVQQNHFTMTLPPQSAYVLTLNP